MKLKELHVHQLRNIGSLRFSLNPNVNFILGANGSGKTTCLEALYLLGTGHSFRTRDISSIIAQGQENLTVFARSEDQTQISVQKSLAKPTVVKINQSFCSSSSQLAHRLPIQVFYQDIFQIIDAGPALRRSLIDWGLFHVKPNYLPLLTHYKHVLKQRNALLRQRAPLSEFVPWNEQLASLAEQLHIERDDFFRLWREKFFDILSKLTSVNCNVDYFKGWDKKNSGISLLTSLDQQFESDQQRMYTQSGAHQADLIIESIDQKARHILSRGQQKMILIALKLSQAELAAQNCLYLFDDLAAELDKEHQKKLFDYLSVSSNQIVITSPDSFDTVPVEMILKSSSFNLSSGEIHESEYVPRETMGL